MTHTHVSHLILAFYLDVIVVYFYFSFLVTLLLNKDLKEVGA